MNTATFAQTQLASAFELFNTCAGNMNDEQYIWKPAGTANVAATNACAIDPRIAQPVETQNSSKSLFSANAENWPFSEKLEAWVFSAIDDDARLNSSSRR